MKSYIFAKKKYKVLVFLFFAFYLCIGLCIFRDYGISWDEHSSRERGIKSWEYLTEGNKAIFEVSTRYHGTAFEILLVGVERALNIGNDSRTVFLTRHLVTFLLFYIGLIFFYRLCIYKFHSWKIGLLGGVFFMLSPRIFAHSFYNPKDIPFLAMFIVSMHTLFKYLDNKTFSMAFLLALSSALLVDIRITGIMVPVFAVIFFVKDVLLSGEKRRLKPIGSLIAYIFLFIFFAILFWPLLWESPLTRFIEIFKMSYPYEKNFNVLYLGDYINPSMLPWHYIPVWIGISTPVVYIFCFFVGFIVLIKSLLKNSRLPSLDKRNDLIIVSWFLLPLVVASSSKVVVYDGWRHLFFIYPAFLIISLKGVKVCFSYIKAKTSGLSYKIVNTGFIMILTFNLIYTAFFMVRYYPYQNVYFNIFAGKDMKKIKNNFPLDYWGLSYRKALEYILKTDRGKLIKIYVANKPGRQNIDILPADDRKRLEIVDDPGEARYFLSDYRWHKEEYPYTREYYSIKIDGAKIMVVYKIN